MESIDGSEMRTLYNKGKLDDNSPGIPPSAATTSTSPVAATDSGLFVGGSAQSPDDCPSGSVTDLSLSPNLSTTKVEEDAEHVNDGIVCLSVYVSVCAINSVKVYIEEIWHGKYCPDRFITVGR